MDFCYKTTMVPATYKPYPQHSPLPHSPHSPLLHGKPAGVTPGASPVLSPDSSNTEQRLSLTGVTSCSWFGATVIRSSPVSRRIPARPALRLLLGHWRLNLARLPAWMVLRYLDGLSAPAFHLRPWVRIPGPTARFTPSSFLPWLTTTLASSRHSASGGRHPPC